MVKNMLAKDGYKQTHTCNTGDAKTTCYVRQVE